MNRGQDILLEIKTQIQDILFSGKKGTRGRMDEDGFVPIDYLLRLPEIASRGINLSCLEYIVIMSGDDIKGKKLEFNKIRSRIRTERQNLTIFNKLDTRTNTHRSPPPPPKIVKTPNKLDQGNSSSPDNYKIANVNTLYGPRTTPTKTQEKEECIEEYTNKTPRQVDKRDEKQQNGRRDKTKEETWKTKDKDFDFFEKPKKKDEPTQYEKQLSLIKRRKEDIGRFCLYEEAYSAGYLAAESKREKNLVETEEKSTQRNRELGNKEIRKRLSFY